MNSGTAALHLALSLFNIKNREVILPAMSFVSTANAILYNGGIPVFTDVKENTLCLDPDEVMENITENIAAIIPVHFGGMPCPQMRYFKGTVIEDAAHAAGGQIRGDKIGSHGAAVCFSFHPVKNLAMPSGGAICLNNVDEEDMEVSV